LHCGHCLIRHCRFESCIKVEGALKKCKCVLTDFTVGIIIGFITAVFI